MDPTNPLVVAGEKIQVMFKAGIQLVPLLPILKVLIAAPTSEAATPFLKQAAEETGIDDPEFLRAVLAENNKAFEKLLAFLEQIEATRKFITDSGAKLPLVGEMMFRSIINEKNIND